MLPSYCLLSLLFLDFRQLECDLSDKLHELSVLSLQLDDLSESRLSFGLLSNPAVYGVLFNAMVLGGLNNGNAVILDAVDNLLLHVVSDAMLFHMPVC